VLRALHWAGDKLGFNADGQTKVNVHSLRHSFISNAVDLGLTIPEAALLARQDPATTAATYARVAETKRKQAASKLAAAIGGAR
jgi:integrase